MILPIALGAAALVSGVIGLGAGARGSSKIKRANNRVKTAAVLHEENIGKFKAENEKAIKAADSLGRKELEILAGFDGFFKAAEKLKGAYSSEYIDTDGIKIHELLPDELMKVSTGASVLFGSIGGTALGTACGIGAAGATTAAVTALGTASTGAAISSLSGAAASNAALAALGGGAIAAGGGGMALGTIVLGGSSLGMGLLIGGIIFNITGSKITNRAEYTWAQMRAAEDQLNEFSGYFKRLTELANEYYASLSGVQNIYEDKIAEVNRIADNYSGTLTDGEKAAVNDTYTLVKLLYDMCRVKLVNPTDDKYKPNGINEAELRKMMELARVETADLM